MRTSANGNATASLLTWIVVKPAILAGLYRLIKWVTLETGYTQGFVPTVAGPFGRFTGITYEQATVVGVVILALSGVQLASAVWRAVTTSTH